MTLVMEGIVIEFQSSSCLVYSLVVCKNVDFYQVGKRSGKRKGH